MTQPPPEYGQPQYGMPPGYGPPPVYGPGYGQPFAAGYGYPGYAPPATEGNAIAALILAIASFVVCPFISAVIALVLAGSAKRSILASGGTKQGLGMVTAARIIAWANIALGVVAVVGVLLVVVAVHHSGGVSTGT
jgi:hypothetical protein